MPSQAVDYDPWAAGRGNNADSMSAAMAGQSAQNPAPMPKLGPPVAGGWYNTDKGPQKWTGKGWEAAPAAAPSKTNTTPVDFNPWAKTAPNATKSPAWSYPNTGAIPTMAQGLLHVITDLAGAPVDAVTALWRGSGVPGAPDNPLLGSTNLRQALAFGNMLLGMNPPTYEDTSELRPRDRSWALAGETMGSVVVPTGVLLKAGAATKALTALSKAGKVRQYAEPVLAAARTAPGRTTMAELSGGFGAAQVGGLAAAATHHDPRARALGEIVGGFVSPTSLATKAGRGVISGVKGVIQSFSAAGRTMRAAKYIQDVVRAAGESPERLAAILQEQDAHNLNLSSAQKSNSTALKAVEDHLAKGRPKLASKVDKMSEQALDTLRETVAALQATGNPEALRAAAALRKTYFDTLLSDRVAYAEQRAIEVNARLSPEGKHLHADASADAHKILEDALDASNRAEKELWSRIPKDIPTEAPHLKASLAKAQEELLSVGGRPIETLPEPFNRYGRALTGEGGEEEAAVKNVPTTSKDLLRARSRALELGREARSAGKWGDAHRYDMIADGALQDLQEMKAPGVDEARAFSKAKNDAFARTFAGKALAVGAAGAERISPELMLERAFGGGGTAADLRFRQLGEATSFPKSDEPLHDNMLSAQDRFLRQRANEFVTNGRVDPAKLQRFVQNNAAMLNRFPALKADLQSASKAEQALAHAEGRQTYLTRAAKQKSAFSKLINSQVPAEVVKGALSGANPFRDYRRLANIAAHSGAGALGGLRSATIEQAFNAARDASGDFSWIKFREQLTRPIANGQPSVIQLMQRNGVMTEQAANRLTTLVDRAIKIETAVKTTGHLPEGTQDTDILIDTALRSGGSWGAKLLGKLSGIGSTLIMQSAGSKLMRTYLDRMPSIRVQDLIEEAAVNPQFMAMLLEKPTTITRVRHLERQLNAFLITSGLTATGAIDTNQQQQPPPPLQ